MASANDPVQRFWEWFQSHEASLFDAPGDDPLFGELLENIRRVHANLTWECGVAGEVPRELIFSADGIKAAFPAVEAIVDAAPRLDRWRFVRFRPRSPDYAGSSIRLGDRNIHARDIEYVLTSNGTLLGVDLFIRGCQADDEEAFVRIAFIFMDSALGEYDMECKLYRFKVHAWDSSEYKDSRRPFSDLREHFDEAFEQLCTQEED